MTEATARTWRPVRLRAQDGVELFARDYGDSLWPTTPILALPGLTRTSRDFHDLGVYFTTHSSTPRRVIACDFRGRGLSGRDPEPENYTPITEAADVLSLMTALDIEQAIIIGTSRGGLVAMVLAALRPTALAAVVLNDIGPEVDATGLKRLQESLGSRRPPADWNDAKAILKDALEPFFPAWDEAMWDLYTRVTFAERNGKPVSDFDPAILASLAAFDPEAPLPTLWPQFEALSALPVMVVRGANSDILSHQTLQQMQAVHPGLKAIIAEGQGHAPHFDDALCAAIEAWIATWSAACPSLQGNPD